MKPFLDSIPAMLTSPSARAATGQESAVSPLFLLGRINSFGRLVQVLTDEPMAHEGINSHGNFTHIHGHENV
jgi:hypothetical protein